MAHWKVSARHVRYRPVYPSSIDTRNSTDVSLSHIPSLLESEAPREHPDPRAQMAPKAWPSLLDKISATPRGWEGGVVWRDLRRRQALPSCQDERRPASG